MQRRPWSETEVVSVLALYYQIPFGAIDEKNLAVIELAYSLDRTPGSVALKLANLASLDPTVIASGRRGMANASQLDRRVFADRSNDWAQLATELPDSVLESIDRRRSRKLSVDTISDRLTFESTAELTEVTATAVQRKGQSFFRNATLAAYRERCCITLLPVRELLRASHIIPWAADASSRLDPTNGLCLNALYDAAFDRGLMTIDEEHRVVFARGLRGAVASEVWEVWFGRHEGQAIELPERLLPRSFALAFHREHVFAG